MLDTEEAKVILEQKQRKLSELKKLYGIAEDLSDSVLAKNNATLSSAVDDFESLANQMALECVNCCT